MKTMLLAAVLGLAACGGSAEFDGDTVIAKLDNGAPSCSQGATGPTLHTRTAIGNNNGTPYESTIVDCVWTCGNINGIKKALVDVIFYTDPDGVWVMDPHADPSSAVCP